MNALHVMFDGSDENLTGASAELVSQFSEVEQSLTCRRAVQ